MRGNIIDLASAAIGGFHHAMRVAAPILLSVLLMGAAPDPGPPSIEPDAPLATPAEEMAQIETVQSVNEARAKAAPDAPQLRIDPVLTRIARARSSAMAHGAPFAHDDGHGKYPGIDMVRAAYGPYGYIGENIFEQTRNVFGFAAKTATFDPDEFAKTAAEKWMASEEHRENIVSPNYNSTGIGIVTVGDHTYATQIFRGPPPPPVRAKPKDRAGPAQRWIGN